MLRMIELAIPKEAMKKAIFESAKRLQDMTQEKLEQLRLTLASTHEVPEMWSALRKLRTIEQKED